MQGIGQAEDLDVLGAEAVNGDHRAAVAAYPDPVVVCPEQPSVVDIEAIDQDAVPDHAVSGLTGQFDSVDPVDQ